MKADKFQKLYAEADKPRHDLGGYLVAQTDLIERLRIIAAGIETIMRRQEKIEERFQLRDTFGI